MGPRIKNIFFFPIAHYFAFFAAIRLKKWHPRVIVITGSTGKTTLFALVESQLGNIAHYSHHANSAIGIPFDILDLHRKTLKPIEWVSLVFKAPIQSFKSPYSQKLYIVECDADRPGEGKFLAKLLQPEVTLWISSARTHSMNFDRLVPNTFKNVEEAIAYEFGYFIEKTSSLSIVNGDSELMQRQLKRTNATIEKVTIKNLDNYYVSNGGTAFSLKGTRVKLKALLPKEIFYSLQMTKMLCDYLQTAFDPSFPDLKLPPARSSLFRGIKNITIIDSTYNANFSSMYAIVTMFNAYPAKQKWIVIGDMLEQGKEEMEEHEKLAELLLEQDYKRIVLLGPRVKKYTYPKMLEKLPKNTPIAVFENPKDVLVHLQENIRGGETVLFKGARFLEGVIENLLLDKKEKSKLARREKVWEERRKKWGL
jgi:UDP-N-acetylmuramoyl-tripeptide--D-alanyl-D-alanine ligase